MRFISKTSTNRLRAGPVARATSHVPILRPAIFSLPCCTADACRPKRAASQAPRRGKEPGVAYLTKPTRGRVALWSVLAFLWFLFLPQEAAMDGFENVSVGGAIF